jgi:hypothetical protein
VVRGFTNTYRRRSWVRRQKSRTGNKKSAFITAQIAGNEVVYSVVLSNAGNPLSREDVESHFKRELSKEVVPLILVGYPRGRRFKRATTRQSLILL